MVSGFKRAGFFINPTAPLKSSAKGRASVNLLQSFSKKTCILPQHTFTLHFKALSKMNNQEQLQTLQEIKALMDRNSRFLSLSGLSGVFAGLFALAGAAAAYFYLKLDFTSNNYYQYAYNSLGEPNVDFYTFFFLDAGLVLGLSLLVCYLLTSRNIKKEGGKLWDSVTKRLTINMMIPLCTGGVFCLLLLHHTYIGFIAPAMLIFYGLALVNASKYTHDEVRTLGIIEIALGLAATYFLGYGLLFWALGFGVMHIIYGLMMYNKYEKRNGTDYK